MTVTTGSQFRDEFRNVFAPDSNTTAQALADAVFDQPFMYRCDRPYDANANSTSVHTLDTSTATQVRVKTFKWGLRASVTSDNTNNATVALVYNNGNGGSDTTVATINTATTAGGGSGNITLEVPYSVAVTAANAIIPSGSQLQVKVTKSGAGGLALPHSSFEVKAAPV